MDASAPFFYIQQIACVVVSALLLIQLFGVFGDHGLLYETADDAFRLLKNLQTHKNESHDSQVNTHYCGLNLTELSYSTKFGEMPGNTLGNLISDRFLEKPFRMAGYVDMVPTKNAIGMLYTFAVALPGGLAFLFIGMYGLFVSTMILMVSLFVYMFKQGNESVFADVIEKRKPFLYTVLFFFAFVLFALVWWLSVAQYAFKSNSHFYTRPGPCDASETSRPSTLDSSDWYDNFTMSIVLSVFVGITLAFFELFGLVWEKLPCLGSFTKEYAALWGKKASQHKFHVVFNSVTLLLHLILVSLILVDFLDQVNTVQDMLAQSNVLLVDVDRLHNNWELLTRMCVYTALGSGLTTIVWLFTDTQAISIPHFFGWNKTCSSCTAGAFRLDGNMGICFTFFILYTIGLGVDLVKFGLSNASNQYKVPVYVIAGLAFLAVFLKIILANSNQFFNRALTAKTSGATAAEKKPLTAADVSALRMNKI